MYTTIKSETVGLPSGKTWKKFPYPNMVCLDLLNSRMPMRSCLYYDRKDTQQLSQDSLILMFDIT